MDSKLYASRKSQRKKRRTATAADVATAADNALVAPAFAVVLGHWVGQVAAKVAAKVAEQFAEQVAGKIARVSQQRIVGLVGLASRQGIVVDRPAAAGTAAGAAAHAATSGG